MGECSLEVENAIHVNCNVDYEVESGYSCDTVSNGSEPKKKKAESPPTAGRGSRAARRPRRATGREPSSLCVTARTDHRIYTHFYSASSHSFTFARALPHTQQSAVVGPAMARARAVLRLLWLALLALSDTISTGSQAPPIVTRWHSTPVSTFALEPCSSIALLVDSLEHRRSTFCVGILYRFKLLALIGR